MKRRLLLHKEKGNSTYVATLISIFMMVVLFLVLFLNYAQITNQNKVERVYRKYLLRMETEGCLTASMEGELVAELTSLGLKNISLSGSSNSPVGYGGEITLHIEGDLPVDQIKFGANASPARVKEDVHVSITKTGTALY